MRVDQIEAVMAQPRKAKRLAEPAGAGREVSCRRARSQTSIDGHLLRANQRLKRAQENAASFALDFAGNIRAEIAAIDRVDVGVTGGTKQDQVARCGAAVRVSGRIGWAVVGAEVGFDFDDPSSQYAGVCPMGEDFAEQARGYLVRRRFKEGAGEDAARHFGGATQVRYLMNLARKGVWSPRSQKSRPGARRYAASLPAFSPTFALSSIP